MSDLAVPNGRLKGVKRYDSRRPIFDHYYIEPALRQALITDGHAPAHYRAFSVRNSDPWYSAFGVKTGQALYLAPDDRVRVW